MFEWLDMGKHAGYVWAAYGCAAFVFLVNVLANLNRRRRAIAVIEAAQDAVDSEDSL